MVFRTDTPDSNRDFSGCPLEGERTPVPLLIGIERRQGAAGLSRLEWLAYVSNESGARRCMSAAAREGGRVPVSTGGGGEPLWSPDGTHALLPRRRSGHGGDASLTSPALAVVARDTLFAGPYTTDLWHPNYDVAPDGKGFVMVRPVEQDRQLIMVVNWGEELRQRTRSERDEPTTP